MIDEIKTRLASLGYEATTEEDDMIQYLISKVEEEIKNATNLSEVPEGLHYELVDAVCGEFLQLALITGKLENVEQVVNSIKEGDTTVTLSDSMTPQSQLSACLRSFKLSKSALAKYRVLVW